MFTVTWPAVGFVTDLFSSVPALGLGASLPLLGSRGWLTSQISSIMEDVGPYGFSDGTTHVLSLLSCTELWPAIIPSVVKTCLGSVMEACPGMLVWHPPWWRARGSGADDPFEVFLPWPSPWLSNRTSASRAFPWCRPSLLGEPCGSNSCESRGGYRFDEHLLAIGCYRW